MQERAGITRPSSLSSVGVAQPLKDKFREPLEGKDAQARIARQRVVRQQLPLQLKRRLLRREEQQRRSLRRRGERRANLAQAAIRLAAARGAEEEARLHAVVFTQHARGAREFPPGSGSWIAEERERVSR